MSSIVSKREVGVDGGGAEAQQAGEVVHLARLAGLDDEAALRAQALADEVVVDGGDGQERGDRGVVGIHRAVGEDEDLVAVLHVLLGLAPQAIEGPLHAPGLGLEAQRQGLGLEVLAVHPAQPLEVLVGEHGLRQLDDTRVLGAVPEDVALAPHEGDEAHDHLLPDGVDRGIGHLGEELVEVVEEVPGLVGQDRERRVVAHRPHRFLAVPGHRGHQDAQVLERVAEGLLLGEDAARRRLQELAGRGEIGEGDLSLLEPARVGPLGADAGLDLLVRDDAPLLEGSDEHPARLETALADDLLRGNVEDPRLRGHDEDVVVGQAVARRSQPVAVEGRADERSVRERDRSRAVPGLDDRPVVLVEGPAVGRDLGVLLPGLGDEHHHHVGEAAAAHHEELDHVVEGARVRAALLHERLHLLDVVVGEERRGDDGLARLHPVDVPAEGVDLAVVRQGPERMGQRPRRQHVRREAAVDEGERRLEGLLREVGIVGGQLRRRQHPLVDDRARRHRAEVEARRALDRLPHQPGAVLARDEQPPLEVVLGAAAHRPAHDHLLHQGLARERGGAEGRVVGGHDAPAEDVELQLAQRPGERVSHPDVGSGVLRQEALPDRVAPRLGQGDPEPRADLQEEGVGELRLKPRSVSGLLFRAAGAPVVQVQEDLDPLANDVVGLDVLQVGDEADPASVVLEAGIVKAVSRLHLSHPGVVIGPPGLGVEEAPPFPRTVSPPSVV